MYNILENKIINYINQTPENTNPSVLATLLSGLNKQSDWNQNDDTQPDYIKNRPLIATNDDILNFLVDIGAVVPITNLAGEILISSSDEIYYL